jgi:hypothetical protein
MTVTFVIAVVVDCGWHAAISKMRSSMSACGGIFIVRAPGGVTTSDVE